MWPATSKIIRIVFLSVIVLSIAMIGIRVAGYPRLLELQGSMPLLLGSLGLLLLYVVVIVWFTARTVSLPIRTFSMSTAFGTGAAVLQIAHLAVERYLPSYGLWGGRVTLLVMFVTFGIWGLAALNVGRSGMGMLKSVRTAVWCAIVTMSITVCVGVVLEFYLAPIAEDSMRTWPEFARSGWSDLHAFAIANTLDSVVSHLTIAPVVAAVVGALGWSLSQVFGGAQLSLSAGRR
jgi:hypothetical protein